MGTVLVTVAYGTRRRDLAVRADLPIAELLGPLAQALVGAVHQDEAAAHPGGSQPGAPDGGGPGAPGEGPAMKSLALAPLCGRSLPAERSLGACGVGHGAVLVLIDGSAVATPARSARTRPPLVG
jgi:hypothetical protein